MRSPATLLAERAAPAAPADGLKVWRDAAQAQITEPVIDACLFSRQSSYSVDAVASHSGPLVGMLLRKGRKIQRARLRRPDGAVQRRQEPAERIVSEPAV